MDEQQLPEWMNTAQLCKLTGWSRYKIRRITDTYDLPRKFVGSATLYPTQPFLASMQQAEETFGWNVLKAAS